MLRDPISVPRPQSQALEDQHVERAGEQLGARCLVISHSLSMERQYSPPAVGLSSGARKLIRQAIRWTSSRSLSFVILRDLRVAFPSVLGAELLLYDRSCPQGHS